MTKFLSKETPWFSAECLLLADIIISPIFMNYHYLDYRNYFHYFLLEVSLLKIQFLIFLNIFFNEINPF